MGFFLWIDNSGWSAQDTPTNDNNGNLTYDGTQTYTYDAWNRMKTVAHAYRDSEGVHSGQTLDTMTYDALNRRIVKAISGTGIWDCTYNYYLDGERVVEERNGSNVTLKTLLWGGTYVDELVHMLTYDPVTEIDQGDYIMQDANWNVMGMGSGSYLDERYEYTPYGQRMPFEYYSENDIGNYEPTVSAIPFGIGGSGAETACGEFGFQGLQEDEESGLVYARNRYLSPQLGRWMTREPYGAGYVDGMNLYECFGSEPINGVDPFGLRWYDGWGEAILSTIGLADQQTQYAFDTRNL
jgi:RHS repeat-associated protein